MVNELTLQIQALGWKVLEVEHHEDAEVGQYRAVVQKGDDKLSQNEAWGNTPEIALQAALTLVKAR